MPKARFGNDPAKIERYWNFWNCAEVARPLVGFSFVGWFPFGEFAACHQWTSSRYLTPDMIDPAAFVDDHVRMLEEGEIIDDDLLRGAGPTQVAVPFLPGIVGCKVRILSDNVMGEEQNLGWEQALRVRFDDQNPWFQKYVEFGRALAARSGGLFPVSHNADLGPTDLHAVLRSHSQAILDLTDEPERSAKLLAQLGEIFFEFTCAYWKTLPLYHGGYFDGQYSLWSPGPIARLQEDATAVYSPSLYRKFVQPVDRALARRFACSFMHLHSTSMFLLDAFLEIEEIRCFEINNDVCGSAVAGMVPHFQKVQRARRPLLIRGSFTTEELKLLLDSLEPRGLFLNIMVKSMEEIATLRRVIKM